MAGYEGFYHSHPDSESFSGFPHDKPDKSSDKQIADDTEKPCYVVTPRGNMERYDPDPNKRRRGQETTIGKAKK
jgi:hypothetical protein